MSDKSRIYSIALGEWCESAAAIALAIALRAANACDAQAAMSLAIRVKDLLSRLIK